MTGLDATIARALAGYNAGDVLSFDSLREAANAAQLGPKQLHGQIVGRWVELFEVLRVPAPAWSDGLFEVAL